MTVAVVIIAKNEAPSIERCIQSAQQVSDQVVVVDSGSTDNTVALARGHQAMVIESEWLGYGATRNKGAMHARYDWIFSLDADEVITPALAAEIKALSTDNITSIYNCPRVNFFGSKQIHFGDWKGDKVLRLYNRKHTRWNEEAVHETIEDQQSTIITLRNPLWHYTVKDLASFIQKNMHYAELSAIKYAAKNKKASVIKMCLSPFFTFIKGYVFRLGFLDGIEGFWIARINSFYTFMKYSLLRKN